MKVEENLRKIHVVDGLTLCNDYGPAQIHSVDIGLLSIPSGCIVMGDPLRCPGLEDLERKTFFRSVTPGDYPVVVYQAQAGDDIVLAFAEILFSNENPVSFEPAKSIYDTKNKRKGKCGYIVHDSQTGFMDAEVFRSLCALPRTVQPFQLLHFDSLNEETGEDMPYCIGASLDGALSAAYFRVQSGCYYWYWGTDAQGNICCLIADFFSFV